MFLKRIIILLFVFSIPVIGSAEDFQGKSRSLKDPVSMVYLPGGTYMLGAEKGFPGARPDRTKSHQLLLRGKSFAFRLGNSCAGEVGVGEE